MSSSDLYFTPLNNNSINVSEEDNKLTIPRKILTINKEVIEGGNCGDFPQRVIIDIPLKFSNENEYIITDKNNITRFKFHNNSKAFINDNIYLGCGTFSAIYSVKLDKSTPEINSLIPDKYKDSLILRIYQNPSSDKQKNDLNIGDIDINNDLQSNFIKIWMKHKKLFPNNIIDIYLYGDIQLQTIHGIRYIGFYTITRHYIVDNKIQKFSLNNKMLYLKNAIEFLKKLEVANLTLRDLKFENSGSDSDYNFIVIDYDDNTILNEDEIKKLVESNNLGYSIGTYPFTYLIMDDQNYNYRYIYLTGLLDIVTELFKDNFSDKTIYDETRLLLVDIVNVYRDYIRNYYYSNPIKKILWYVSDNKTNYETIKIQISSLFTNIKKQIKDNKDKILYELLLGFCISCLVFSSANIRPNFLSELKDLVSSLKSKIELSGGYYLKYLKYKNKYLELKRINSEL
jgi:hypothetical protein